MKVISRPPVQSLLVLLYIAVCVLHAELIDVDACSSSNAKMYRYVGYPVFMSVVALIWHVSMMDPGIAKGHLFASRVHGHGVDGEYMKHCDVCDISFPAEAKIHHCKTCAKCIVGFDHHCIFLGTCIGAENKLPFIYILGLGAIGHALLASMSLCSIDHIRQHVTNFMSEVVTAGIKFKLADVCKQVLSEIYNHGLAVYYLCISWTLLLSVAMHISFSIYDFSTLQLYKELNKSGMTVFVNRILSKCSRPLVDKFMTMFHKYFDVFCCWKTVPCSVRWKIISLMAFHHALFGVWHLIGAKDWKEFVISLLGLVFLLFAVYFMRAVVILPRPERLGTTESYNTDIEDQVLDSFCEACGTVWRLRDHHCSLFGICVMNRNRLSYIRFCVFGILSSALLVPFAYNWLVQYAEFEYLLRASLGEKVSCGLKLFKAAFIPLFYFMNLCGGACILFAIYFDQISCLFMLMQTTSELDGLQFGKRMSIGVMMVSWFFQVTLWWDYLLLFFLLL